MVHSWLKQNNSNSNIRDCRQEVFFDDILNRNVYIKITKMLNNGYHRKSKVSNLLNKVGTIFIVSRIEIEIAELITVV